MLKRGDTVRVHLFGGHSEAPKPLDLGIVQSCDGGTAAILWLRQGKIFGTRIVMHSDNLYLTHARNVLEKVNHAESR